MLRTRPRGAGVPETSPFSGEGLGLPPPPIASLPLPLLSPRQHHPPDLAVPCPHCVTTENWKKSLPPGHPPPGPLRALFQPLLAASALDLPDSFLWACTSRPGHPCGLSPGTSQPHGSNPSSPPPASAGHGVGRGRHSKGVLSWAWAHILPLTPAACGLGTVSVMGLSLLNGHSSQCRLETRAVEAGDQNRGFGF